MNEREVTVLYEGLATLAQHEPNNEIAGALLARLQSAKSWRGQLRIMYASKTEINDLFRRYGRFWPDPQPPELKTLFAYVRKAAQGDD